MRYGGLWFELFVIVLLVAIFLKVFEVL